MHQEGIDRGLDHVTKPKPTCRPSSLKATRIQVRFQPAQKAVLARAAHLRRTTLSSFMLEHACEAAQQVLAEQVDVVLPPEEWAAFCKALRMPPRVGDCGTQETAHRSERRFRWHRNSRRSDKPTLLEAGHDLAAFDCGVPALNSYLKKFALENQRQPIGPVPTSHCVGSALLGITPWRPLRYAARKRHHALPKVWPLTCAGDSLGSLWRWMTARRCAGPGSWTAQGRTAAGRRRRGYHRLSRCYGPCQGRGGKCVLSAASASSPLPADPFRLFLLMKDIKASLGIPSRPSRKSKSMAPCRPG